jgi:hypothetical protein
VDVFASTESDYSVMLNNHDELVWARYAVCNQGAPSYGSLMFHSGGETIEVDSELSLFFHGSHNDHHHVAYSVEDQGLYLWRVGAEAELISPKGFLPDINNQGDIAFLWNTGDAVHKQVFLYRKGEILQITNETEWVNDDVRMNDWGEMVWQIRPPTGLTFSSDIMLMRRIRNGEANFDGKVDWEDHARLASCLTGPGETDGLADCRFLDIDHDRDVDLGDFGVLQNNFGWQVAVDSGLSGGL